MLGLRLVVHVDLGGVQMRMFSLDHPHQAPQPALLQVGQVVGQHGLGFPGDDIQAGRLARDFGKLAGDAHQVLDILLAPERPLLLRVAVPWLGEDDHTGESAGTEYTAQPFGIGQVVVMMRPGHRGALRALEFHRVGQLGCQQVPSIEGADQQPCSRVSVRLVGHRPLLPFDGQQPLIQHAISASLLRHAGAESQPMHA